MNNSAFIFDGQGHQFNNFGKDFYENDTVFKKFVDKYKEKFDLNEVYEKDENDINTEKFQPATFLVEMAIAQMLKQKGISANNFAGSSLGEYSALCSANFFSVEDGIELLKKRGNLMNDALSKIDSGMMAIMFLDKDKVKDIAKVCNCEISNINSFDQCVISGLNSDLKVCERKCIENGARRTIKLASQGAFHSKYLKDIATEFEDFLNNFKFNCENENNVYFNLTGKKEHTDIQRLLSKQVYSTVNFLQIIINMLDDGIDTFYEIGPGGNLAFHINNIARTKGKKVTIYKINSYKDI